MGNCTRGGGRVVKRLGVVSKVLRLDVVLGGESLLPSSKQMAFQTIWNDSGLFIVDPDTDKT